MPDFSRRSDELEIMDDPAIAGAELFRTLDELEIINTTLGGYQPSLAGIAQLLPPDCRSFTLLDVGCGCGDLARRIIPWAKKRGIEARVKGIDLSADTAAHAALRSQGVAGVEFAQADLFEMPDGETFDIVHAAMVLHHCPNPLAARFLARMHALSRRGLVINDIHRHWIAFYGIKALTTILSRSRLVRNDAAVSVARAFRRQDLIDLAAEANLPAPEIRWRWAFRWQMVVQKGQA